MDDLTNEESSFALAVVEYGGNLGAAFRSVYGKTPNPIRRGQELVTRPEIAIRIKEIAEAVSENALISLGSHLLQLAVIRDRSMKVGDMRTGLAAEVKRGEVAGFYKDKMTTQDGKSFVQINIGVNPTPANAEEWGEEYGNAPIVIDMPK